MRQENNKNQAFLDSRVNSRPVWGTNETESIGISLSGRALPNVLAGFDSITDAIHTRRKTKNMPSRSKIVSAYILLRYLSACLGDWRPPKYSAVISEPSVTRDFSDPVNPHGTKFYEGSLEEGPES